MKKVSMFVAVAASVFGTAAFAPGRSDAAPSLFARGTPFSRQSLPTQHPRDRRGSWMSPAAKSANLLYVSDSSTSDVYAYSLPQGQLMGTLTGFNEPVGLCVDRSNDVFVANYAASNIVEYAHGGTSPINTLTDPSGYPWGCSVDPTTGNLAVTNILGFGSGSSNILVYPGASGNPAQYADPSTAEFRFCGYDNQGNLFASGLEGSIYRLEELAIGSSSLTQLTLDQNVGFPGGVQWDGRFLAVGDDSNHVYRFIVNGGHAYEVGLTLLNGNLGVSQFWIQGKRVIAPDYFEGTVLGYRYPAGGSPVWGITGLSYPLGATVSKGSS
jgi:hypothetical protein